MARIRRELALALTLGLFTATVASAQFADADWELLLPQDRLVDVTVWDGRVVGADAVAGLLFYDVPTSTLSPLTTGDGLTSNRVLSLLVDGDETLWLGTADAGVVRLELNGRVNPISSLAGQGEIRDLDRDGDFVYYASASGGGAIANGFPEQVFDRDQGLPSDDVTDVAAFGGRVWFATPAGVGFFDRAANAVGTLNTGLAAADVAAVAAGPDGVFCAVGQTIYELDEGVPGVPVWTEVLPGPGFTVLQLDVTDGEIVALGTAARLRTRALAATTWDEASGDAATDEWLAVHRAPDGQIWTAGRRFDRSIDRDGAPLTLSAPLFWSSDSGASPALPFRNGDSARAIESDGAGGVWIGFAPPEDGLLHWRADGSVISYPRFDTEQSAGDGDGWLTGIKFGIERAPNGDLWIANFAATGGLTRFRPDPSGDPTLAEYFHLTVSDDVLKTRRILDMQLDDRGRLWLTSDGGITPNGDRNLGIDVLLDLNAPTSPTSWLKITAGNSQLAGDDVSAIAVDGDVVWIGVDEVGLQRWDVGGTGDLASALGEVGRWDLIERLPENVGDELTSISDIAVADDGRIWIATGDQGCFAMNYNAGTVAGVDIVAFEVAEFGPTLISNQQRRIISTRVDEAWSGGEGGLHRLRIEDRQPLIDPFTDAAFFLQAELSTRFGGEIVSPLPISSVWSLDYDAANQRLVVGTDLGVARVRLRGDTESLPDAFDVMLRPNPLRAGDDLHATDFEGTLDVYVYTLGGRQVHRARGLTDGDRAWDTRNIMNENVVSGLYLVRLVRSDGAEVVRTVAIER